MKELDINKIAVELVKQFSKPVLDGLIHLGKDSLDKAKVSYDLCFTKYIDRTYIRYSKTKTLLYRDRPVNINDFYVRTDLSFNHEPITENEFIPKLKEFKRVVVSGTAGSGKSIFCKSIFLELIENPTDIFPIFVELRHLNENENISLSDYVVNTMINIDSSFSKAQFEYALKLGKVVLILDGFDEINSSHRDQYEKEITQISDSHENVLFLISSRPDNRFSSWGEFYQFNMLPLDKNKAQALISKLDYDRQLKRKFLTELERKLYDTHESFASNPLLLTMMLLTYEQIAEIPNKIHLFYEQAFLTLFNKHDSIKNLYKRKSFSGLPLDDFKKVLSALSILTYSDRKYSFTDTQITEYLNKSNKLSGISFVADEFLSDLLDGVCILQRDGLGYSFTHRSFQEYFTALFLVSFVSDKKYELIDKIAFINDRDDVIPMLFDINKELIEKEWVIPKSKIIIGNYSLYPNNNEGNLRVLNSMYSGLVSRETKHNPFNVAYRHYNKGNTDAIFFHIIWKIYSGEFRKFHSSLCADDTSEQRKILLDNDFDSNGFLDLTDLSLLSEETKLRIVNSGCHLFAVNRINFLKLKLESLNDEYKEKQSDVSELLFS